MTTSLWIAAVLLIIVGVAGTVLPALPGIPLIFGGVLLAAWIDDFQRIGTWTLVVLAVLAVFGVAVDYVAAALSAQRVGASRQGVIGAAIGEFLAHRNALRAGKVGAATWFGLLVGTAVKIAVAFTMIGVFLAALVF